MKRRSPAHASVIWGGQALLAKPLYPFEIVVLGTDEHVGILRYQGN